MIVGLILFFFVPPAHAQENRHLGTKFGLTTAAGQTKLQRRELTQVTGTVIGTILSFIAIVFFGLMLYGGVRWMLARGNEDEAKKALETITAAILGIIVVLGSYALTNFVLDSVKQGEQGDGSGDKVVDEAVCRLFPGGSTVPEEYACEGKKVGDNCLVLIGNVSGKCFQRGYIPPDQAIPGEVTSGPTCRCERG